MSEGQYACKDPWEPGPHATWFFYRWCHGLPGSTVHVTSGVYDEMIIDHLTEMSSLRSVLVWPCSSPTNVRWVLDQDPPRGVQWTSPTLSIGFHWAPLGGSWDICLYVLSLVVHLYAIQILKDRRPALHCPTFPCTVTPSVHLLLENGLRRRLHRHRLRTARSRPAAHARTAGFLHHGDMQGDAGREAIGIGGLDLVTLRRWEERGVKEFEKEQGIEEGFSRPFRRSRFRKGLKGTFYAIFMRLRKQRKRMRGCLCIG